MRHISSTCFSKRLQPLCHIPSGASLPRIHPDIQADHSIDPCYCNSYGYVSPCAFRVSNTHIMVCNRVRDRYVANHSEGSFRLMTEAKLPMSRCKNRFCCTNSASVHRVDRPLSIMLPAPSLFPRQHVCPLHVRYSVYLRTNMPPVVSLN